MTDSPARLSIPISAAILILLDCVIPTGSSSADYYWEYPFEQTNPTWILNGSWSMAEDGLALSAYMTGGSATHLVQLEIPGLPGDVVSYTFQFNNIWAIYGSSWTTFSQAECEITAKRTHPSSHTLFSRSGICGGDGGFFSYSDTTFTSCTSAYQGGDLIFQFEGFLATSTWAQADISWNLVDMLIVGHISPDLTPDSWATIKALFTRAE